MQIFLGAFIVVLAVLALLALWTIAVELEEISTILRKCESERPSSPPRRIRILPWESDGSNFNIAKRHTDDGMG